MRRVPPIGDRIEIVREASATGPYSLHVQGLAPNFLPAPQTDAYTAFSVTGAEGGRLTSILVAESVELLAHDVAWTDTDQNTADPHRPIDQRRRERLHRDGQPEAGVPARA